MLRSPSTPGLKKKKSCLVQNAFAANNDEMRSPLMARGIGRRRAQVTRTLF